MDMYRATLAQPPTSCDTTGCGRGPVYASRSALPENYANAPVGPSCHITPLDLSPTGGECHALETITKDSQLHQKMLSDHAGISVAASLLHGRLPADDLVDGNELFARAGCLTSEGNGGTLGVLGHPDAGWPTTASSANHQFQEVKATM